MSPTIFNYWFKKYKIKANYGFLQLNKKNFDNKIQQVFLDKKLGGLNITIPFKQDVIKYVDVLDNHSKKINAVNCIVINSKIKGVNTDWLGYYKSIPIKKKLKR